MISTVAKWVISRRWLVVIAALISTIIILFNTIPQMPLDVFPNFAPPQVEIETEAPGLAPEEIESLVTLPIESSINGTPGISAVRSSSSAGLSVVRVVFGWGTDIYQARQLVQERLQQVVSKLPQGIETPRLAPISSPIGTVLKYAFTVEEEGQKGEIPIQNPTSKIDLMEVRRIVDWQVTNRLLAVPGVSQVLVYGGEVRQYQVLVDPNKLRAFNVSLQQVSEAVQGANVNAPGGFLISPDKQTLIRGIGRIESLDDLKQSVIVARQGTPVRLGDVAEIQIGGAIKIGDGSLNGKDAVVVMVNKQPLADTPTVTRAIEAAISELEAGLPKEIKVNATFRQADYIDASVENVRSALVEGSIIAAVILIPFLMNWRTLGVVLLNFALTFIFSLQVLSFLGLGLNTMTLGGLAIAIGTAIDDAIVYAENVFRLLRQNKYSPNPSPILEVVFQGVEEVQESLIGATLITIVVFSPIFALAGVEGRIFGPMGLSYLVVVIVSSLEALLVSPALCAILLPHGKMPLKEPLIPRIFKRLYYRCLNFAIHSPMIIISVAVAGMIAAIVIFPALGRAFLPEFQESTLVNTLALYPGSSLEATNSAAFVLENKLKDDPRLKYVQLRAGRAPSDPDAAPVNLGHLDIGLSDKGMEKRKETVEWLREEFNKIPGAAANIGGFISHRIDEILSGVRSQIAVKIFGSDLEELRRIGQQVEGAMSSVSGLVDLQLEPQVPIEQIQIKFDRVAASRYGLTVGQLSELVETALNGKVVSQVLDKQQSFDLIVWLQSEYRNNLQTIENLLVDVPSQSGDEGGNKIPLAKVATVTYGTGPNTINRENVSRLIVVSANAQGKDLRSVVNEIKNKVKAQVQLPSGYFIQYGGQFEAEERASQNILIFSAISFVVITVLMYLSVKSIASTAMIMINLPIALVGGVIAVALTGGVVSVASLVGFVTLFGVATRNGLLLVDNYTTKFSSGMSLKEILIAGSMERLNAILMTSFTSALGLVPLVIASGPGKEVLQPLSIVVLGGLFTSTALTLLVLPALYSKFGRFLLPKRSAAVEENGKVAAVVLEN
ncbi:MULTISPECIES: efflux RND transporter permease subunit [Nostocales]|uniref:CusA/CzcA family heavy metal efflux RND transporter n=1 Tax=Nostoc punctiforme FACHB-252 TaxID=1357509 RepID=A0ABR8HFL4_NOSPU|nr:MULTISPECIES: efflux RND transporter permease subunit [Nostocales]BAY95130.1 heavy metal efflux pump, CzcA family protein [Microchaete diplosiphon NIES-3275]EKE97934.1 heavy metal efflux pump, CzcA family [Tolypothrix sp. PCC 7601]MBD2614007.1 CusA/CzcA family heavy metal efflux RND transporter [Nostoc punctiforme FACHB-252]MBE9080687.1 CusA/CzcA family heavy metal efflux RND transporter [Tolypothrix sp. LEGE 11397]UYD30358.1 CusA/CzcA family heavy metal efflux RND transporter [Tolypothrix 